MHVAVQIEIDASPQAVWDDVSRIDSHVEWMSDAQSIRFTSESVTGIGTSFVCDTRIGPLRTSDAMEITSWVPGREIGVRHCGAVSGSGRFTIEPLSGGERTLFRWTETLRFGWWLGGPLGARIGARLLRAVWRRNLTALAARFADGPVGDSPRNGCCAGEPADGHASGTGSDRDDPSDDAALGDAALGDAAGQTEDTEGPVGAACDVAGSPINGVGAYTAPDIEQHSMLSDQRTVALVAPGARINWMCLPRIDSPAVFAELLSGPAAGYFSVAPDGPASEPDCGYVGDTLVLRTEWPGLAVTDYLDCSSGSVQPGSGTAGSGRGILRADCSPAGSTGSPAGDAADAAESDSTAAPTVLVRVLEGSGRARIEFAPRLDFGRCPTRIDSCSDGLVVDGRDSGSGEAGRGDACSKNPGSGEVCSDGRIVLRSPGVDWEITAAHGHHNAVGLADLDAGPVTLELLWLAERPAAAPVDSAARPSVDTVGGSSDNTASGSDDETDAYAHGRIDGSTPGAAGKTAGEPQRRASTAAFWQGWADSLDLPEPGNCLSVEAVELAKRSALTLKALCHAPTGAIAAAATTSLPEWIGGVRNWDYRYCWIRDAALAAGALVRLGSTSEALDLCDWLAVLADAGDELLPLYAVDGQPLPHETEIAELAGYLGSKPVRVGNAADHQMQIDVYGHVAELVHRLAVAGISLTPGHHHLVERCVDMVARCWRLPDNGMWEVRSEPRHHVNSKTMCWVAVDRAVGIAAEAGSSRPEWEALADRIRDDLLTHGCSQAGPFTTAYDGDDLDASALAVGLYGLLPGDDPRFAATVSAVESQFRRGSAVYRYRHEDGFADPEGAFSLMTSWLIDAKILVGDVEGASELFEAHLGVVGPTGLMAEEVDPASGRALGNFPQAYSHSGLIENVCNLAAAQS